MKVYLKARSSEYLGEGDWDGKKLTVKKGSIIKKGECRNFKPNKQVLKAWVDCVDEETFKLKKDVVFMSPSTAAQLITKNSTNGWKAWKTREGICLSELREK